MCNEILPFNLVTYTNPTEINGSENKLMMIFFFVFVNVKLQIDEVIGKESTWIIPGPYWVTSLTGGTIRKETFVCFSFFLTIWYAWWINTISLVVVVHFEFTFLFFSSYMDNQSSLLKWTNIPQSVNIQ